MKVQVIGVHWGAYLAQGSLLAIDEPTAAVEYSAPDDITDREDLEDWVLTHSGDFSQVTDFAALPRIEFDREESEFFYFDCMGPAW